MTPPQATASIDARQGSFRWPAIDTAQACADFADPRNPPPSQRQYARQHSLPRSTLGSWLRKDYPEHLGPQLVAFFRSPVGLDFLRRHVLALLLVFHHRNPCGLRPIAAFLELVGLDAFVASSYGALYNLDAWLQTDLALFAGQERQRLASGMAPKDIVLCPDEHFHAEAPCLVAIEPVSNFIVVEAYHPQRDSTTWVKAIRAGLAGLPVQLVLLTSDQASGLVCSAKELQVAHEPDLLHLQHDLCGPVLLPLVRPIQQAEKDLHKAERDSERLDQAEQKRPDSVPVAAMLAAVAEELDAEQRLQRARGHREQAVQGIRRVSEVYHPFDRQTGQPVTAEQLQAQLGATVAGLQKVVEEADLAERSQQAVTKARGWVLLLVGCLGWFWTMVRQRLEEAGLSAEAEGLVRECLLGSCYWQRASLREKSPDERNRLRELAAELWQQAWQEGGALAALPAEEKKEVERLAWQCVGLFCRSSSCVEGRNGRLSLFHHAQTRLSGRRLQALTAVHNYVVRREDGTTAAERFFGQQQGDAFSWLLKRMPDLPRPAAKRPKKAPAGPASAT